MIDFHYFLPGQVLNDEIAMVSLILDLNFSISNFVVTGE
jgi:hypothetical protein